MSKDQQQLVADFAYVSGKNDGIKQEQERILNQLKLTLAVYGGFRKDIADVLLDVIERINPEAHAEVMQLIGESK